MHVPYKHSQRVILYSIVNGFVCACIKFCGIEFSDCHVGSQKSPRLLGFLHVWVWIAQPVLHLRVKGPSHSVFLALLLVLVVVFPNLPGKTLNKNFPLWRGGMIIKEPEPQ